MTFTETSLFYLAIGLAVAVAVFLRGESAAPFAGLANAAGAVFFWPLYLPVLLTPHDAITDPDQRTAAQRDRRLPHDDELAVAINQVETELDTALAGLGGWAESALAVEQGRIAELRSAWTAQAQRIREIDRLLTETAVEQGGETACGTPPLGERLERSRAARQRNFDKLARVRGQAYDDLLGTLAWVRELVSMIHLARFTGAPASRAEELVAQIAAAVAGVSEAGWSETDDVFNSTHEPGSAPAAPCNQTATL
jgi:hypothetical protein